MIRRSMRYVEVLDSKMAYVDEGISDIAKPVAYLQADHPDRIGIEIAAWLPKLA
jgi:hypothetical protein